MPRVANFADIMKTIIIFIKTIFKDSKKLKELDVTHYDAVYICISFAPTHTPNPWAAPKRSILNRGKYHTRDKSSHYLLA